MYLIELHYTSHGTSTKSHELANKNTSISHGKSSLKFLVGTIWAIVITGMTFRCWKKTGISEDIMFFVYRT